MRNSTRYLFFLCVSVGWLCSCQRSTDDVWNDTKTAGRHVGRGLSSIGGKNGSSRQIADDGEFGSSAAVAASNGAKNDYIALADLQDPMHIGDAEIIAAPEHSPGDPGSPIPGIESFTDPALDPELAPIFEHVHFEYDSSVIKGEENIRIIQNITTYLKNHPNVYVFVEGHCDKRGSAAYNFGLGANRANFVRKELIDGGISPDRVFTISYGKEKPLFEEDGDEFHRLNRRAQFKVYQR